LVKIARWDPDKRWDAAVRAVATLKRRGMAPLFLARGGMEDHGHEVLEGAAREDLRLVRVRPSGAGAASLIRVLEKVDGADMVVIDTPLSEAQRRYLYRVADAVLANSGLEPFGLVGLEAMACGGIALVGCTGEDYVTPGHDAIALQSSDPMEIVHHVVRLRRRRAEALRMRRAARKTAARYTWEAVFDRCFFPFLEEQGFDMAHSRCDLRSADLSRRRSPIRLAFRRRRTGPGQVGPAPAGLLERKTG